MAAGDDNRVWFPEMIETLRSQWSVAMPFTGLIELCNVLDGMLQRRHPEVHSCLPVLAVRNAENREFRKSATTRHQRPGNYSVIGPIRYRFAGSDQAD
jgi:hypothetical protein